MSRNAPINRREFLKASGLASAAAGACFAQSGTPLPIILPRNDPIASSAPVRWAAGELQRALTDAKYIATLHDRHEQVAPLEPVIVAGRGRGEPESFLIWKDLNALTVNAPDARGMVYALLELADRARSQRPLAAPATEKPYNKVRSIQRLFTSDVEDKPWFHDREMWPQYLTMLAGERFNRFNLSLGIGYDFLRQVTDAYFLFAYPFLLPVSGYNVRAVNLPDAERDRNLETLKFIAKETAARGLEFQLGIWMHGYVWENSPRPNYTIEGLNTQNHGPYCRDALAALLRAVPEITGVTLRIHGESGVAEGSYEFWQMVFEGARRSGRKVELDLHAKGIDQKMIDLATATGLPIKVAPKYWAEHMGMPYHQSAIRDLEMPKDNPTGGFFALSNGTRSFMRYGYGDLLREGRRYDVLHRIWPGTQRLLLWGDPASAAAYSRAFRFEGSAGVEIMEPLSFKGRRGSGIAGNRNGYADKSLQTRWDWEKYRITYHVWGRALYNPDADTGPNGPAEIALASASRILPIITTAHLPSAANNTFWPEIYTNHPIMEGSRNPYTDTPAPRVFGNVTALDPQMFYRINDYAGDLLKGERSGKYSPIEVANWLEHFADAATASLAKAGKPGTAEARRLAIDVEIQADLGRFFAAKFRAGVLYAIFDRTGEGLPLSEALAAYNQARTTWTKIVDRTKGVYVADVTVGELPWLRGHWADRLPAIEDDLSAMAKRVAVAKPGEPSQRTRDAVAAALSRAPRIQPEAAHKPAAGFRLSQPLEIAIQTALPSARLYYRHVNQAERWQSVEMTRAEKTFRSEIPAEYTNSPFALQYYFELRDGPAKAWLYPGFGPALLNQPYYLVDRA